jgi:hypothetical protein
VALAAFVAAKRRSDSGRTPVLQLCHCTSVYCFSNFFSQNLSLDFHRRGAGKILLPDQITAHSLEVGQLAIAGRYIFL